MERLKTLLVANRGEIAARICKSARKLGIKTVAIYSNADAESEHVSTADEAVLLPGQDSVAYIDQDSIIQIAKDQKADAVAPGYGFLSENADFARALRSAGVAWVGPSPEAIEAFGIKHIARDLAEKAGVAIVPGTKGLVNDENAAVDAANSLGFPVMLKATGGGGGMGLVTCENADEVRKGFNTATSRAQNLFKNPGVFIERYYPASRHIEVQVFGNGQGKAIHFGERECSIQRRHQKVIEECPSPLVSNGRLDLRETLTQYAVSLSESVKYASAGTVEFLVDDKTGDAFFLEMNTRLQVEHGITELCYGVDLVEMMLEQADAELLGKGGLDGDYLGSLQSEHSTPNGAAIEARVYAENPVRNHAASPGLLQLVRWGEVPAGRVDTWVYTGVRISPNYDPLIAKVMLHASSRDQAMTHMIRLLKTSTICGPPNNLDFLAAIISNPEFAAGRTLTNFLSSFNYTVPAFEVLSGGAYTLVQDMPGRPTVAHGIPHSGPMDPLALQVANALVGNPTDKEGLEITLRGPELRFLVPAVIALCGAPVDATVGSETFPMWTQVRIKTGQTLKIGKIIAGGCRAYLAVYGGFPNVAPYLGSKSTSPLVALGGYQGRALAPGDLLSISTDHSTQVQEGSRVPTRLIPEYSVHWEIATMVGPHDNGFLLPEDIEMIYSTQWKVSHNANRSGIRLLGPVPKWARKTGGEGGSHPSNMVEYGYPIAALNWTGDDPCIFPVDCPGFGGFLTSTTIAKSDWYKLGQLKAGDTLRYRRVSFDEALAARRQVIDFVNGIEAAVQGKGSFDSLAPLDTLSGVKSNEPGSTGNGWGNSVLKSLSADEVTKRPSVTYRQGGDSHIIIEYGNGSEEFDLNHKVRVSKLEEALSNSMQTPLDISSAIIQKCGCCTTLMIMFDPLALSRAHLLDHLAHLETSVLGDLSTAEVPTRVFSLPITFDSQEQQDATKRYMETQRPHAPYLPDNMKFVAENNAFSKERLQEIYVTEQMMAVVVGFYCGNTVWLPVDPRVRMSAPKLNPSRVHTPAGTVGWGGACMSIYPVASPGGYQMTGRTIPIFDAFGNKPGFFPGPKSPGRQIHPTTSTPPSENTPTTPLRPWLFQPLDILTFTPVSNESFTKSLNLFNRGAYTFPFKPSTFSLKQHNDLLNSTTDEVKRIRQKQHAAQAGMMEKDKESLRLWREEKEKRKEKEGAGAEGLVEEVEKAEGKPLSERVTGEVVGVRGGVDANVWKILVEEGAETEGNDTVVILEAMKLEVEVKWGGGAEEDSKPGRDEQDETESGGGKDEKSAKRRKAKVEKILVKQNETVKSGDMLVILRLF